MNNSNSFSYIVGKVIPTLLVAIILGFIAFWSTTNNRITKLEDNQKWMKETYKIYKSDQKERVLKLESKIEEVLKKEDKLADLLKQILTRLGIIEYELKINGRKK